MMQRKYEVKTALTRNECSIKLNIPSFDLSKYLSLFEYSRFILQFFNIELE